jgi:hypothetical protein
MGNDPDKNDASSNATTAAEKPGDGIAEQYLGLLLKDRYLIERELGRGGIGVVYLARDQRLLSRPVVVKVLAANASDRAFSDWFHKKFRQEMEALVRINHPGVVGVLDSGEMPDGKPFLVMQYVEGITLREVMPKTGMEFGHVARVARQIGHALSAAHGKGVCHRDLKPENVMLERPGSGEELVKLIDFGVARVDDSLVATSAERTWVAGTPAYMSPEQLRGRPTIESDIYAFGALAYEMLTGRTPFNAETTVDLYELQRKGEFAPPRQLRRDLPQAAQTTILRALSFSSADRHPSAQAFGEELARALTGGAAAAVTAAAKTDNRGTVVTQPQSRETSPNYTAVAEPAPARPAKLPWIVAAVVTLVLAATIYFFYRNRPPASDQPATATAAITAAERSLEYWIMARKYRGPNPAGEAFKLPGAIFFEAGDRIFLHLSVAQPGYFYLLNEGPLPAGELPSYNLLFPKPGVNQGLALLAAGQELKFPERGEGMVFDKERGTEKLWLVWAEASVPELEAVKSVVNPKQQGAITDPAAARSVRDYLQKAQTEAPPSAREDKEKSQTRVTARGAALVHRIELLHY